MTVARDRCSGGGGGVRAPVYRWGLEHRCYTLPGTHFFKITVIYNWYFFTQARRSRVFLFDFYYQEGHLPRQQRLSTGAV